MADSETKRKSWRDVLQVHPAADIFPMMSREELVKLGNNIKERGGLTAPIALFLPADADENTGWLLLDGRNRLDAMEAAGITLIDAKGKTDAWREMVREIAV